MQSNPSFLTTVHNLTEAQTITSEKRYWSFPEFKEIMPASSTTDSTFNTQSSSKEKDNAAEFSNFPDSSLYMIGFKFKLQSPTQAVVRESGAQKFSAKEE